MDAHESSPAVPEALRRELAAELAHARDLPRGDPAARRRVRDAEAALGGRLRETPRARLAAAMRALLWHRRPESTICPSDAARIAGGESWRDLMVEARDVAAELARDGVIVVRQRGADVDPATATGPIRLARGPHW